MNDISIRKEGYAGRITLQRPDALNAMTYEMCTAINSALLNWKDDKDVKLIAIDSLGDRAFCAGGDIADLYASGKRGDYIYGQTFWAQEYRMNAMIANYPKPYLALMQGFTMGGGVGISCHGSHRIVGESSKIAMPECGIGLVPDVGGSDILARAPGHFGEYLGLTGHRMNAGDAIYIGFADNFIPENIWPELIEKLQDTGDISIIEKYYRTPPEGTLDFLKDTISEIFNTPDLAEIVKRLTNRLDEFSARSIEAILKHSPLSMACCLSILDHLRNEKGGLHEALKLEYRFTARSMEHGDFIEGIRATIIDKDRTPNWKYGVTSVPKKAVSLMLNPLGNLELSF